jgi:hypothetical protein
MEKSAMRIGTEVTKDRDKFERVSRLMFTWKNLFVTETDQMVGTDLVMHTIPTYESAVPVKAKSKLYMPKERKWMESNIPKLLAAGIIDHSVLPWCHRTKFVPKKDEDLRMVHV